MLILHEIWPVGLVYCKKQFDNFFFGLWRHLHVKTPLWRHFYRQMPSFFQNGRCRQLLLNLYLFLCNLAIALPFLKFWCDKTKLSKRFDSNRVNRLTLIRKNMRNKFKKVLTSAKYSDCNWHKFMLVNKNHLIVFQRGIKNNSTIIFSSDHILT